MKKLILSAAFLIAISSYAAAQTSEGTTPVKATTEKATTDKQEKIKKEKPQKISKKERKAAAAQEAAKNVKISVPLPDISKNTLPVKEEE